jgi:signal transduction histidine kinase/DNA-binding response OmpR family regulator/ligand-binding sensor domain-containing protein
MKSKLFLLILLGLLTLFKTSAAEREFSSINNIFNISIRESTSLCTDQDGFVWASSKIGILRLTNNDYRIYQLPCINFGFINVRLTYSPYGLFAYTNNGQLFHYNTIKNSFDFFVDLQSLMQNKYASINDILVDKKGCFWIGSNFGVYILKDKKLSKVASISDEVYRMKWRDADRIIISTSKGVFQTNVETKTKSTLFLNKTISAYNTSCLYIDNTCQKLWIGTNANGVIIYDFKTKAVSKLKQNILPSPPIMDIEAVSDSTLLFGIDGQGLWELNKKTLRVVSVSKENFDDPFSLKGNGVYDILCLKNGRVWVATYTGGVSYFDQRRSSLKHITHVINNKNSLIDNNVNKIIQDKAGKYWFATNNGISSWNPSTNIWNAYYNNKREQAQVFMTLCEDNLGRIWAGSYASGLYVLDENSGSEVAHYTESNTNGQLKSNFVLALYKDYEGNIWIGGVPIMTDCFIVKENRFRTYDGQAVNSFLELSKDKMLLICSFGLCMMDKRTGLQEVLLDGYQSYNGLKIKDDIWFCTHGEGLMNYNMKTKKINKFGIKEGLSSNFVNSINYLQGVFWLGTENGLCKFDPKKMTISPLQELEQLSKLSFNTNAGCILKNGDLMWGTNNGAVQFSPGNKNVTTDSGKIFLQDINISGRSLRDSVVYKLTSKIDSLKVIKLKYFQNNIRVELLPLVTGFNYSRFSWKLEGMNDGWSIPSQNRFITYTNLPSGSFTLKIRMYDSSLTNIIAERELKLKIVPPFWETWWFFFLSIVFIVGLLYFAMTYYVEHLNKIHSEEKVRFFTNTAHEIRTSLTLIQAPIEELRKETKLTGKGKQFLSLSMEHVQKLSAVINQLMDFQKVDVGRDVLSLKNVDLVKLVQQTVDMFTFFAKTKKIELVFESNVKEYYSAVDEEKMVKIFDNLLSNAIKYSKTESKVIIHFIQQANNWVFEVQDFGIGISRKAQSRLFNEFFRAENAVNSKIAGSGIGLLLIKKYVDMHGGQVELSSKEEEGSIFRVIIPHAEGHLLTQVELDQHYLTKPKNVTMTEVALNEPVMGNTTEEKMRILIVEDNDQLRSFMKDALEELFVVETASDGQVAWDFVQNNIPDLIVSDIMMPNMDGFELCKRIKEDFETSHIPVILLSALTGKAEQLNGLGLGADDYLTKPFDMGLLIQRIKTIVRNRKIVHDKTLNLINVEVKEPILNNIQNDKFLKTMLKVIQENMSNTEFGKDDFASAMNVSSSLLYKKVKALTDQSPVDYIKSIRLEYAVELLKTKNYTITEISEMCGFSSVGYFSTVFKKRYGITPSES